MFNHNPDLEFEFEGGERDQLFSDDDNDAPQEEVTIRDPTNWPLFCCKPPSKNYASLGEGHYCEISNCGRQAYSFCDEKMVGCFRPAFEGCSKKLCEKHIEHHYSKRGKVTLRHCKYVAGDIREDESKA